MNANLAFVRPDWEGIITEAVVAHELYAEVDAGVWIKVSQAVFGFVDDEQTERPDQEFLLQMEEAIHQWLE